MNGVPAHGPFTGATWHPPRKWIAGFLPTSLRFFSNDAVTSAREFRSLSRHYLRKPNSGPKNGQVLTETLARGFLTTAGFITRLSL